MLQKTNTTRYDCANIKVNLNYLMSLTHSLFWLSCWWNFWEIPISDGLEANTLSWAGNWISILIHALMNIFLWYVKCDCTEASIKCEWTDKLKTVISVWSMHDMLCFSGGNIWISVLISFIDTWLVEHFYNRALMNIGTGYHERTKMSFITFRAKYRILASLVL